jgi:hypothetical protein
MEINSLLEFICRDIRDIEQLTANMVNYKKIPQFDIDLALSKIKTIADEMSMLDKLNSGAGEAVSDTKEPRPENRILKDINKPDRTSGPVAKTETPVATEPAITRFQGKISQSAGLVTEKEKIITQKADKRDIQKKTTADTKSADHPEKISVSDRLKNGKKSLIDVLSENRHEKDISTKFSANPITDIRSAISLNDKIYFKKELFDDDADKMNAAIDFLNSAESHTAAVKYLQTNFTWNTGSEAAQMFYALVERRFLQ